jgi:hypothetical protein
MTKVKLISLPDNLMDDLNKVENASGLIQELLREHFRKSNLALMTEEELNRELKKVEILEETERKIKELEK